MNNYELREMLKKANIQWELDPYSNNCYVSANIIDVLSEFIIQYHGETIRKFIQEEVEKQVKEREFEIYKHFVKENLKNDK